VNDQRQHGPFFGQSLSMAKHIFKQYGIRGLYRGLSPNLAGATCSWACYFWLYDMFKTKALTYQTTPLSAKQHLLASAEAGNLFTLIIYLPISYSIILFYRCIDCYINKSILGSEDTYVYY
jgi:hypothetical protein